MTRLLAAAAIALCLVGFSGYAHAQWTGNNLGNFTFWNNSRTGQSVTCNRIGNFTFCN